MPLKREVFEALQHHGRVAAVLDPRQPGVDVPDKFRAQPALVLNFNAPTVTAWGLVESMTFGGVVWVVRLPWTAVTGMQGVVGQLVEWADLPEPPPTTRWVRGLAVLA